VLTAEALLKLEQTDVWERRRGHIDPTKEVFAQFRDSDRPGPIHMLNLVRLRKQAAYPDGRKTSAGITASSRSIQASPRSSR
jgi:hypothetical protein